MTRFRGHATQPKCAAEGSGLQEESTSVVHARVQAQAMELMLSSGKMVSEVTRDLDLARQRGGY